MLGALIYIAVLGLFTVGLLYMLWVPGRFFFELVSGLLLRVPRRRNRRGEGPYRTPG